MNKFLIILFILPSFLFSQQLKEDSLLNCLKYSKEDTSKANTLNRLAAVYRRNADFKESMKYSQKALLLSNKLSFSKGIFFANKGFGIIYFQIGKQDSAIYYMQKCYDMKELEKNDLGMCECSNLLGLMLSKKGDYIKSLQQFQRSLQLAQKLHADENTLMAINNIAILYQSQGNKPKAVEYYEKALVLAKKQDDPLLLASVLAGMGNVYVLMNENNKAYNIYKKAFDIRKEFGNELMIAKSYSDLGYVCFNLSQYEKALAYYKSAIEIFDRTGSTNDLSFSYYNVGNIYYEKKDFIKAIDFYQKSLTLSEENDDLERITTEHQKLGESYNEIKKYKEATYHLLEYQKLKDSLTNQTTSKQLVEMESKYQSDKKEAEINLQNEQLKSQKAEIGKQTLQKIIFASALFFVIVIAVFIYKNYKSQKRSSEIIQLQQKETEIQKNIIEDKHKEITDSINYAERIQRSFLATKDMLDENLNNYFVFFKPKDVVSGDFYWASKIVSSSGVENFALVTADSTGHGVPGAIMSLLNITSLESAVKDGFTEPSDILNATRKTIIERLKKDGSAEGGKDGMDCSLTVYDFKNKKLIVAAANNPVWIMRKNTEGVTDIIEIKPDKMPVGKHDKDKIPFTHQEIQLQTGDVVYTLTDGFPDQFGGEKGKKFMSKNLRELLAANAHLLMEDQKDLLETTFKNWVNNLEQVDDVTIIGVRI